MKLREFIRGSSVYYTYIFHAFVRNPFFHLLDDELAFIRSEQVKPGLRELLSARAAAAESTAPKYAIFCMPKSGSSFVQSALQSAFQIPFLSTSSVASPKLSSLFGMNSREQEVDDLAVISATLASESGFVSQSHTRYSGYLGRQIRHYGITPLVTVRNVLDCIVSFDEMMLEWRKQTRGAQWGSDAQFALPLNYPDLGPDRRYELLGRSFGVWLIAFYLSWKRGIEDDGVTPVVIRYEEDVVDPERFIARMEAELALTTEQRDRLALYVRSPDRRTARLNVGRAGRGRDAIPQSVTDFLADHLSAFADEITPAEAAYLLR